MAEYLHFLIPFSKSRIQQSNIPLPAERDDEGSSSNHVNEGVSNLDQSLTTNETELVANEDAGNIEEPIAKKQKRRHYESKTQKMRPAEMDPLEKCAVDYFRSKNITKEVENPDLQFLKSLLPDIERMNNLQKHQFKMRTMQTIGDILYTQTPQNSFESVNMIE